ncbi:MAG: hypothetical protein H6732_01660 [Alphaproteobacteria bacterium]|nr:hypothetical protein [Alphaproteobacteria bacterium]
MPRLALAAAAMAVLTAPLTPAHACYCATDVRLLIGGQPCTAPGAPPAPPITVGPSGVVWLAGLERWLADLQCAEHEPRPPPSLVYRAKDGQEVAAVIRRDLAFHHVLDVAAGRPLPVGSRWTLEVAVAHRFSGRQVWTWPLVVEAAPPEDSPLPALTAANVHVDLSDAFCFPVPHAERLVVREAAVGPGLGGPTRVWEVNVAAGEGSERTTMVAGSSSGFVIDAGPCAGPEAAILSGVSACGERAGAWPFEEAPSVLHVRRWDPWGRASPWVRVTVDDGGWDRQLGKHTRPLGP